MSAPKNVWLATPEDQIKYTYGVDNHKKDSSYVQYTLHSEYEALEEKAKILLNGRASMLLEVERLQQQVESLKADAARYRWLRDAKKDVGLVIDKRTEWVPHDEQLAGVGGYWVYEYRAGGELDHAIDAAIQGAGGEL